VLRRPGQEAVSDVRLRRAFPWTSPDRYVSVRDAEGKELLLIDDLSSLEPDQRVTIERSLADGSFIPKIIRVREVDVRFGYQQWRVETDRGAAEFRVQEREDIRFLPDGRFRIKDADGTVYEMVRLDQLDEKSRGAIEALI
jgi:CO/xanthine dehydrogenase FAD-binding subunit